MKGLLVLVGAGDQGRPTVVDADEAGPDPGSDRPGVFLVPDQLLDRRQAAAPILGRPRNAGPATVVLRSLPRQVELAAVGPVTVGSGVGRHVAAQPGTYFVTERELFLGEVEIHQKILTHLVWIS